MPPPRHSVAPNDIQNVYPLAQRVPLGPSGHMHYAGTRGPGDAGHYWFYVPTTIPGRVIITVEGGSSEIRLESDASQELRRTTGQVLGHELPPGSVGIYHVFVTPVRPAQVRFIADGWPKEKNGSPLVPWNFWYYPFNPSKGRRGAFDSSAVQRSAMQKYDDVFLPERLDAAWGWEKNNHIHPNAEGWEGHCDMASFASVYFEDPPATFTLKGVTFTREELRFLATEWANRRMPPTQPVYGVEALGYATVDDRFVVWFMKPSDEVTPTSVMAAYSRCFGAPRSRAKMVEDATRLDPEIVRADFGDVGLRSLNFLVDHVKLGGRPVLGDFGPTDPARIGTEVWNYVLVLFLAEWRELPQKNRDPRSCEVQLDVVTNLDTWPPDAPFPPAVVGRGGRPEPVAKNHQVLRYQLEVHHKESGVPHRARFSSCLASGGQVYAPHTLLDVPKPGPPRQAGNPFMGDELLNAGALTLRARFRP